MISWIASLQDCCDETSKSIGRRCTECSVAYLSISLTCGALRPLVSRILAYTMCPALASARAVNAPKPLDAPVLTINFFMAVLLLCCSSVLDFVLLSGEPIQRLSESAVSAQHLPLAP